MPAGSSSDGLISRKRRHSSSSSASSSSVSWPAPLSAMNAARDFIRDVVAEEHVVLIVPDKDADGLSAGTLMYHSLVHLGLPPDRIQVHHLLKGNSVHSDAERERMSATNATRFIVLDQGSRPGRSLVLPGSDRRVLIIDHHMSDEWPEDSVVLTACHSNPIATASLLTYIMLKDLHPRVVSDEGWRAVMGVIGDLGPGVAKWGEPPWPSELARPVKDFGSKTFSDAVSAINAPRRTAEYNVPKAWDIILAASKPREIATNAFLKLCRLDVNAETEKWARTAPKFSQDGKIAVIVVHSGFQIHPVIATRWAGSLGRKSKNLIMVMCANSGFNPDPKKISFSCRIAASLRSLPDSDRPNLIALLEAHGNQIPGFRERVGGDFARGHKEATGGIIQKDEFDLLLAQMGVGQRETHTPTKKQATTRRPATTPPGGGIMKYFKAVESPGDSSPGVKSISKT